jgi:hypothetical protein
MRRLTCGFACVAFSMAFAVAGEAGLKSGPQPGAVLPGPFDALNINGKIAEGRQHCLVCQNALNPAVLVFAREPAEGKDKALTDLMKRLDEAIAKHGDHNLGGFVVFLSPYARSSVTGDDETRSDTTDLLDEATKRSELVARLKTRAEPLKHVILAAYTSKGPKGYNINTKADVTVVFYNRLKVAANWAFEEGKMNDADIDAIVKKVDETMAGGKKK